MSRLRSAWVNFRSRTALKVALVYALISGLWILFSDQAVELLISDPALRSTLNTLKGWAFVLLTALVFYVLIERDLAARRHVEEALRQSEERFRVIFEHANDAIHLDTADDEIVQVNQRLCDLMGYSREELLTMRVSDLQAPEVRQPGGVLQGEVARHGDALFERLNVHRDGHRIPVEVSVAQITGPHDTVYVLIVRDITERKRAEAVLLVSEERYRDLFQSMLMGFAVHEIICDETGHPNDYRFLAVNPAFEQLTGLAASRVVGRTVREVLPDTESYWIEIYGQVALTGEPIQFENYSRELGKHFQISAFRPQPNQFAVTFVDITKRKLAEQQVLRLNRLYLLISQVNQTIVRVRDRQQLFNEICRVAIEYGKFRLAWIGLTTPDGIVQPIAHQGEASEYLTGIRISVMDARTSLGPMGLAVREGRCVVSNDIQTDATMRPSLEAATRFNLQSLAAVPIRLQQTVIGALAVYADELNFFDLAETVLLEEIGSDISFALDVIEQEQQRQRAEQAVVQHNRELTALLEVSQRLARQLEVDAVLQIIVQAVYETVPAAEGSSAWLYDAGRDQLLAQAWSGHADDTLRGLAVSPQAGLVGRVFQSRQPYVSNDTRRDPAFESLGRATPATVQSVAGVPLIIPDRTLGALFADNFTRLNAFEQNDVRLLQTLAAMAASALHNAQLYRQINSAAEHLRQLTAQVVRAQEEERHRLSLELHDEAGQALTALKINLQLMQLDLPTDARALRESLTDAVALTDTTMQQIRSLSHGLRPPALDALGLTASLAGLCRDAARRANLDVRFDAPALPVLPDAIAVTLYRCLQEALTNVVKHAAARTVNVDLAANSDTVQLTVQDDGRGFDAESGAVDYEPTGIGLIGMTERLELLGGRLEIDLQARRGVRLIVTIPLEIRL